MDIKLLHAANTGNLPTQPLLVLDYGIPPMITAKENVVKQVLPCPSDRDVARLD